MGEPRPRRVLPGDPLFGPVCRCWEQSHGPVDEALAARLSDGRSVLFAIGDGDGVGAFVHFRDSKPVLLQGPLATDETARLLAESPEFAAYSFEQLYFAGGRWTLETGAGPIFCAMAEHLRATTMRWALVAHLHSDRRFFAETAALLESLGFRRRPGDYLTYRLELDATEPPTASSTGPCRWRFLDDAEPPATEDVVRAYTAVFPGDPPEAELRRELAAGRWGGRSGVAYDESEEPVAFVLARPGAAGALSVDRLGTVPGRRGRGVVLGGFLDWARRCRAAGHTALAFQVRATNEAATSLVARLGAQRVKEERFYVLAGAFADASRGGTIGW
jgi:hypothetical protein